LSLKNKENINNNNAEQLRTENTLLKTELVELKTNIKVLTEENSKMSSQLIETIEDLNNERLQMLCCIQAQRNVTCANRLINSRHQACQTMPNNMLFRVYGTSSGMIDVSISKPASNLKKKRNTQLQDQFYSIVA